MRMITACFARALQRWTSRTGMHCLLTFQEVMPINKTRNQFYTINRDNLKSYGLDVVLDGVVRSSYNRSRQRLHLLGAQPVL